MSMAVIPSFYDYNHKFDFADNHFQIAIAVVDYKSRIPKDDPDYVRWSPRLTTTIDNVRQDKYLNYHKCTDEDFA